MKGEWEGEFKAQTIVCQNFLLFLFVFILSVVILYTCLLFVLPTLVFPYRSLVVSEVGERKRGKKSKAWLFVCHYFPYLWDIS